MTGAFLLVVHLFLQLTVILVACRVCGRLFRYLGQTQVVSEMIAGVLLGPSLLGLVAPQVQAFLFPKTLTLGGMTTIHPSMAILYALSQVGLVLYMFLIGQELNIETLLAHSKGALRISLSGTLVPIVMGGALGVFSAHDTRLFPGGLLPWQAGLLIASAMSITAFPMLARILYESGISRTRLGTLTLGAAAFGDAVAWCLLACVFASLQNSPSLAAMAIGGGLLYAAVMWGLGRKAFTWFARTTQKDGETRTETIAILLTVLMFCAWLTDYIGIYSVFGAFVVGICMPRGQFAEETRKAIEPVTVTLLLPIFFIYSGLNTQLRLLVQPELLGIAIVVILVAFVCKGVGCLLAARSVGASWRDSAAIGVLMNARGMMELILVNIALEKGLITPGMFTVLVLMAIVTTLVASPLYRWLYRDGQVPT